MISIVVLFGELLIKKVLIESILLHLRSGGRTSPHTTPHHATLSYTIPGILLSALQ